MVVLLNHPRIGIPGPYGDNVACTVSDKLGVSSLHNRQCLSNPGGAVTGYCYDANGMAHGFLRASGGTITTFDAPGSLGTLPASINPAGTITGYAINTTNERCYPTKRSDPNSVLAAR
jgi:hypothetical protein